MASTPGGRSTVSWVVKIGLLSALSFVIMLFEVNLPLIPVFLKLDVSNVPVLLGGVALGPMAAVYIALVKDLLHLLRTSTLGIGELADFLSCVAYAVPLALVCKRNKSAKHFLAGAALGTAAMVVSASLLNAFVWIPLYANLVFKVPVEAIVTMAREVNGAITNLPALIAFAIAPFNFVKAVVLTAVGMLVYKGTRRFL
jgi:riboflavin transporter FmnP